MFLTRCATVCAYAFFSVSVCSLTIVQDGTNQANVTKSSSFSDSNSSLISSSAAGLPAGSRKIVNETISDKCLNRYSVLCLKIQLIQLIDKLGQTKNFQILPGISLVNIDSNTTALKNEIADEVAMSFVRSSSNSSELDSYLLHKIGKYFSSLSVRVNMLDNPIIRNVKKFARSTIEIFFNPVQEAGRRKAITKEVQVTLWTVATLTVLAFSALSALAGKAMLTATLALILSLACLLRGCGGHKSASHYEIITKPTHLHDVEHLGLTAPLAHNPYESYTRHLIQDRVIPALNTLDTDSSNEKEVVREVIPVYTYPVRLPQYSANAVIKERLRTKGMEK